MRLLRLEHCIRSRGLALVAFALLLCSGCGAETDDGYESTATFPPRTDPLVIDLSKAQPPAKEYPPGKLNESIATLNGRGGVTIPVSRLSAEQHKKLTQTLTELFGTPAAPHIKSPQSEALGFTPERLAAGSRVYKLQCVQCHGMAGDGRGPTSLWVFPPARDFRQGTFKFVSTLNGQGWPTRADILKVLRHGIAGNSMPPFALLKDQDLDDVTTYTLYLLFRGKSEFESMQSALNPDEETDIAVIARQRLAVNLEEWQEALKDVVMSAPPIPTEAPAIRRGHALFVHERSACMTCHINYGRGSAWRYDVWGVPIKPANLIEAVFKAGREPLDLYRRLKCGIPGAAMPPASQLSEPELLDILAFVTALPDPARLPDDVRRVVYPSLK